jgi:hypothetical protein
LEFLDLWALYMEQAYGTGPTFPIPSPYHTGFQRISSYRQ